MPTYSAIALIVLLVLPGCGSTVVIDEGLADGTGGAGGAAHGVAQADASASSGGVPDAGSTAPLCQVNLGAPSPEGTCDGSGVCGGVSEVTGCVHCAMQAECGEHYMAANANQGDWVAWNQCSAGCVQDGSPNWQCCRRGCDQEYPVVAAAWEAWIACTFCRWCVQDCASASVAQDLQCQ